ncbi:MAG TPA: sigma 54-interacting transcriptional regulator [Chthoniobacterales bacterium]|nr:sigma 54-interacting transcriptional regulator [Chthoniobacterales bacterium]
MSLSRQATVHQQFIALLGQCNEDVRAAHDEQEYFQSLCRVLVNAGLFQFAWFGYEDEIARKIIKPVAHSGDLQGFLQELEAGLRSSDYEDSANVALRSGETYWIKDIRDHPNLTPIQSAALERGCTSVISTPVVYDGRRRGAFTLYYNDPGRFGQYVPRLWTQYLRLNHFELPPFPSPEGHEAELRSLIDLIPQHVTLHFQDFSTMAQNRAALDYCGRTLAEIRSEGYGVHPDDMEMTTMACAEGVLRGAFEVECRLRRHDGEYRWFLNQVTPLRDSDGKIIRWCTVRTDIHDRKAAEERLQNENIALREEIDRASMFDEIVGTSRPLKSVMSRIAKVAPTDSNVLITGETGTGKELIARSIHKRSQRVGRPFVSVNCAALPPTLVSSELFGHEKGAFTGAVQRRLGRFEMADGGTIFLDEVGELLPDTQAALLRVLQEREFERVGGGQPVQVDVRVIAATNRDLNAAIAHGSFRQDLLYRLNVFPIEVPPLRERKEDVLMLVEYFVQRYAKRAGKNIRSIDQKTLDLLQSYDWPGNIRELQNVIERSVILSSTDVFSIDEWWLSKRTPPQASRAETMPALNLGQRTEREIIEAALTETRGRVSGPSGAAAKLRIPSSTLETRIKTLKINKHQFKFV